MELSRTQHYRHAQREKIWELQSKQVMVQEEALRKKPNLMNNKAIMMRLVGAEIAKARKCKHSWYQSFPKPMFDFAKERHLLWDNKQEHI